MVRHEMVLLALYRVRTLWTRPFVLGNTVEVDVSCLTMKTAHLNKNISLPYIIQTKEIIQIILRNKKIIKIFIWSKRKTFECFSNIQVSNKIQMLEICTPQLAT